MLEDASLALMQLTAAAFAGVCLYIGLVQHPVRQALPPAAALDDFRAVIPRAEKVQAPLLIVCLLSGALNLAVAPTWAIGVGGACLLAVLFLTVAAVLPINRRLLRGDPEDHIARSGLDLARWGQLHAVRTVLSGIGAATLWL